jgi:hypothetical protein
MATRAPAGFRTAHNKALDLTGDTDDVRLGALHDSEELLLLPCRDLELVERVLEVLAEGDPLGLGD